jgi:hypothetical protein
MRISWASELIYATLVNITISFGFIGDISIVKNGVINQLITSYNWGPHLVCGFIPY